MEEVETRPSVASRLKTEVHPGMWDAEKEPYTGCMALTGRCVYIYVGTQSACHKFRQPSCQCSHVGKNFHPLLL